MNNLKPCKCPCCTNLIDQNGKRPKWYCSKRCSQRAYNARLRLKKALPIEKLRCCLNCGRQFTARCSTHIFHSVSCRSSYWKQQKRISEKQNQGELL